MRAHAEGEVKYCPIVATIWWPSGPQAEAPWRLKKSKAKVKDEKRSRCGAILNEKKTQASGRRVTEVSEMEGLETEENWHSDESQGCEELLCRHYQSVLSFDLPKPKTEENRTGRKVEKFHFGVQPAPRAILPECCLASPLSWHPAVARFSQRNGSRNQ